MAQDPPAVLARGEKALCIFFFFFLFFSGISQALPDLTNHVRRGRNYGTYVALCSCQAIAGRFFNTAFASYTCLLKATLIKNSVHKFRPRVSRASCRGLCHAVVQLCALGVRIHDAMTAIAASREQPPHGPRFPQAAGRRRQGAPLSQATYVAPRCRNVTCCPLARCSPLFPLCVARSGNPVVSICELRSCSSFERMLGTPKYAPEGYYKTAGKTAAALA